MSKPKNLHRITPARPGTHCWCGTDALVTRTMPGIESSYCAKHWALWWAIEMSTKKEAGVEMAGNATA